MTPYLFATTKIVMVCFSIHNFLRQVSVVDRLFSEYDTEDELESAKINTQLQITFLQHQIKSSYYNFKAILQMNSFKHSISLSF